MKRKSLSKAILLSVIALTLVMLLTLPGAFAQQRKNDKLPSIIGMTTLRIGSAAHVMGEALGEILKKQTNKKIRIIPVDAEVARIGLMRSGEAQFAIAPGSTMYMAERGLGDFAKYEWGVQPLQMVWLGPAYLGIITTQKHKDINTVSDLRGKRVAGLPHESGLAIVEGFLAFGGLSWKDVQKVTVPGYIAQFKALLSGAVDAVPIANPLAGILYQIQASPAGLKWIPFPRNDKEGWKRLKNKLPWGKPATVTVGVGLSKEKPLEAYVHALAFLTYDSTDQDLVYLMTKTIGENLQQLRKMTKTWEVYTLDMALDTTGFPHVYHPGAIRYFKEKGLWTNKNEEWNRSQLEKQIRLKSLWSQTLDQAISEKWDPKKLKNEWYSKQEKITGYMP